MARPPGDVMRQVARATAALAAVCSTSLLTVGCQSTEAPAAQPSESTVPTSSPDSDTDACQVTLPTLDQTPSLLDEWGSVFGRETLWVDAWWADRSVLEQARTDRAVKYASFTIQDGEVTEGLGPPRVQAKRLDGKGKVVGASGGYASAEQGGQIIHWWPTGLGFSSHGCWQVTETVGPTSITYVVKI